MDFSDHGSLVNFRMRCYSLRLLEREHTRKVYDVGDPGRGKSSYDKLKLIDASTKKDGEWVPPFRLKIIKLDGILPPEVKGIIDL